MTRNIDLSDVLKTNQVEVTFNKVDGSTRTMVCTLNPAFMPQTAIFKETAASREGSVQVVFDLGKRAFRSFRKSNLVSYKIKA